MAEPGQVCDNRDVVEPESGALQAADEFLQTVSINPETSFDQALLITILSLQIHTAHTLNALSRKVTKMAVDTTQLDAAVQSAIALIEQLAANNDDAATQAAVDNDVQALQASVAANTPAPAPAPEPAA